MKEELIKEIEAKLKELKKEKDLTQELHNKLAEVIQEVDAKPQTVIFVLELIKNEVINQFLDKVVNKKT